MRIDAAEIERLVAEREGRQLEFKQGLPRDEKVARSLAAFANTRGGILLVGVGDRGELYGAPRPPETQRKLREVAAQDVEPPLEVLTGVVEVQGKRIVWCSVPLSAARPHSVARGDDREVPVRVGSSNRSASGATLAAVRAQRASASRLDPLQRAVLDWLASEREPSTPAAFAKARNVGIQRARRAFTQLEVAGRLVGHGSGARRSYALP